MKTLRLIGFGLFAVLMSFVMVSCSGDDDDDVTPEPEPTPETPVVTNPLVGTWVSEAENWKQTATFNSNGTGKLITSEYVGGSWDTWETRFTYTYNKSNSIFTFYDNEDGEKYTYYVSFISSNEMMIDGYIYVRSDGDYTPEPDPTPEKENRTFKVGGVEFTMVYVEGGTFMMGSDDADALDDEKPVHQVTLSDYYIGQTEVTQTLWKAVMGCNPSYFKGDNLPVEMVSWHDCYEFIGRLNEITGEKFWLPTEAQWEFAARGGNYSKGYKYSGSNDIDAVAWYEGNSEDKTHPVGTKLANELGIYDMSGNVHEWCHDWYGSYSSAAVTDPTGPSSGYDCVARGGSWGGDESWCYCVTRIFSYGLTKTYGYLGLRLALK